MKTKLTQFYSELLGEKVTFAQVLAILNAQAAFVFAIFPADISFVLRAVGLAWLVSALLNCKRSGLNASCDNQEM